MDGKGYASLTVHAFSVRQSIQSLISLFFPEDDQLAGPRAARRLDDAMLSHLCDFPIHLLSDAEWNAALLLPDRSTAAFQLNLVL
jgi:hypothetical protein